MKKGEEETNDLKGLAPHLAAVPKDNPFRVPDGYFEGLEKQVIQGIQAMDPGPGKKEQKPAFTVPAGYFDELPLLISDRISSKKPARILPIYRKPAFALAMAAAFLALLLITRPALWFHSSPPAATGFVTVDDLGSSTYVAELDEHLLIEALAAYEVSDSTDRNASSDLENYLIDNHIDLNQISD